ncbi:hypothetical protein ABW20_dc0104585 [Dactylellina cionopaga]|nr:hypothetical protein ABW20_dc0104585 [Dactylellina cionopaga]
MAGMPASAKRTMGVIIKSVSPISPVSIGSPFSVSGPFTPDFSPSPIAKVITWAGSFSDLPENVVHQICSHLPDKDVLKLQLLSSGVRQSLPQSRLDAIHSEKTYYLCSHSIQKLDRLVKDPILADRVKKITFDVGVPHVRLRSRKSCIDEAREYPEDAKTRLHRWSNTHVRRQNSLAGTKPRRPSGSARTEPKPVINYENTMEQTFYLFKAHFSLNEPPEEKEDGILKRITAAFRLLDNLSILEFAHTNPKTVDETERLAKWREYNDHLYALLYIDPKIELQTGAWPWCSWLRPKTPSSLLSTACPAILFCATQAERTISEVRIGDTSWGPQNFGLVVSKFEPEQTRVKDGALDGWETAYYHWVCRYVDDYKATFGQTKRFELCLDPEDEETEDGSPAEISLCLLTMLNNVEELKIWRLRGDMDQRIEQRGHGFVLPTNTLLTKLHSLEVGEYSGITPAGLTAFLKTNSASLRHVTCDIFAFEEHIVSKSDILLFLNTMKSSMTLEILRIDFLVDEVISTDPKSNTEITSRVYLSIDIKENWGGSVQFKVGMKKLSVTGEEVPSKSYWIRKRGWEDLLNYVTQFKVDGGFDSVHVTTSCTGDMKFML